MDDGARDRRGLLVLATGHLWADFLQGAVPALLPFLIAERGYSYAAAGALVLASSAGSSSCSRCSGSRRTGSRCRG